MPFDRNLLAAGQDLLSAQLKDQTTPLFFRADLTSEEQALRGNPRQYIETAITLLKWLAAETIVEIGAMREPVNHPLQAFDPRCCNDGHSTMFWANTGLSVHTVDIDPRAYEITLRACAGYPNVHVYNEDGIAFLERFSQPIDFLFLDAWDVAPATPYSERHYDAWVAARRKMKPTSLVAIDDTDIAFGGKGRLVVPAAIRDGYEPLVIARQTILLRAPTRTNLRSSIKSWIVNRL